jgi:hypothetical protein
VPAVCSFAIGPACSPIGTCLRGPPNDGCVSTTTETACSCTGMTVTWSVSANGCSAEEPLGGVPEPMLYAGPCVNDGGPSDAGKPCTGTSQCGPQEVCGYVVAQGCQAQGQCVAAPLLSGCIPQQLTGCDCQGQTVTWTSGYSCSAEDPPGYAPAPIATTGSCAEDAGQDQDGCAPDMSTSLCHTPCATPGLSCYYGSQMVGEQFTCTATQDGGTVWACSGT